MSLVSRRAGVCLRTALAAVTLFSASSICQSVAPDSPNQVPPPAASITPPAATPVPAVTNDKRILWIVPNFRTSPTLDHYKPLTPKEKFGIATQDAFDRGTVGLAAIFAGEGQLAQSEKSFGNGAAAYGRYFGTAYADLVIGDFMSEGITLRFCTRTRDISGAEPDADGPGWDTPSDRSSGPTPIPVALNSTIRRSSGMRRR